MTTLPFLSARVTQPVSLPTRQAGRPASSATAIMRLLPPTGVAHRCVIDVSLRCATRVARNMATPSARGDEKTALDAARYLVTDLDKEASNARPLRRGDNQVVRGEMPFRGSAPSDCSGSRLRAPQALHMYVQGSPEVPANPDPDEDVLMDLGMFRQQLVRVFSRDGVIDATEQETLDAFDRPYHVASSRYHVRRVFNSIMRNGITRRMSENAKDAGITIVIGADSYPANVIPFPVNDPQIA